MIYKYLIFSLLTFTCFSDAYINICFDILDGSGEKVNIMANEKLPFFPDVTKILMETFEYTYKTTVKRQKYSSYFLRKSAFSCNDPFIYAIPWSEVKLQIVKFSLIYPLEALIIDKFKTAVKPNFTENIFNIDGLFGNAKMKVILMHESNSKLKLDEPNSSPLIDFDTNVEVRKLEYGEIYCMSFLTTDFSNYLSFSADKYSVYPPWKYHIFTISIYKSRKIFGVDIKRYLTEVFPCKPVDFIQRKLKIMVDPKVILLKFEIDALSQYSHFENTYYIKNGQLKLAKGYGYLDFNDIELIQSPLTRAMVQRREDMLIYFSTRIMKLCPVRLPENFDKLGLSKVEIRKAEIGLVYMKGYYVDFSSRECNVFNIKLGTPHKADVCHIEST